MLPLPPSTPSFYQETSGLLKIKPSTYMGAVWREGHSCHVTALRIHHLLGWPLPLPPGEWHRATVKGRRDYHNHQFSTAASHRVWLFFSLCFTFKLRGGGMHKGCPNTKTQLLSLSPQHLCFCVCVCVHVHLLPLSLPSLLSLSPPFCLVYSSFCQDFSSE